MPKARARKRELTAVIDEAPLQLGIWCYKASPIFAASEEQHMEAAILAADA